MPVICRFKGIVIMMYYKDHNPPHFHVRYGEHECSIRINDLRVLYGYLPSKVFKYVVEWAHENKFELMLNWKLAQRLEPLKALQPLES